MENTLRLVSIGSILMFLFTSDGLMAEPSQTAVGNSVTSKAVTVKPAPIEEEEEEEEDEEPAAVRSPASIEAKTTEVKAPGVAVKAPAIDSSTDESEEEEEQTAKAPASPQAVKATVGATAPAPAVAPAQSISQPRSTSPNQDPKAAVASKASDEEEESEEEEEDTATTAQKSHQPVDTENPDAKLKTIERLRAKLTLANKKPAQVVFLRPVNYIESSTGDIVLATMQKVFARYGEFSISVKNQKLEKLSLEGFRGIMGKIKADVVFATVLKPSHFDIFIFDRRTPYYVFYHTEVNPEEAANSGKISEQLAIDQTRVLMRRGLYLYLTNQFYELPRENKQQMVLETQIPRWMASAEHVEQVNDAMTRRYYTSASLGGAFTKASDSRTWAGGVYGLQLGAKIAGNYYFEFTYQSFAYHAFVGSIRYNISNKYSALQIMPGLGGAFLTDKKALDADRNLTLHRDHAYIVPSISFWIPLGELYFKMETQLQVSLAADKVVLQFLPGILCVF